MKRSLACRLMRLGELDVDLETGELLTHKAWLSGVYWCVSLRRERKRRVGKFEKGREGKRRFREKQTALVHRLVAMKAEAVKAAVLAGSCGEWWCLWVEDIRRSIHIDHIDFDTSNNRSENLRRLSASENSGRKRPVGELEPCDF